MRAVQGLFQRSSRHFGTRTKNASTLGFLGSAGGTVPALSWLDDHLTRTATGKGRLITGIHRLNEEMDWILFDPENAKNILNLKTDMLGNPETRPTVFQAAGGYEKPAKELLKMLYSHLPKRYPESFSICPSSGVLTAIHTEETLSPSFLQDDGKEAKGVDPLEKASRLVQEDFVILRDQVFHAGCVVSSFGRLQERFGLNLGNIHAKVQGYDTDLHKPVTRFLDGLQDGKACWRTNWAFTWNPSLKPHPERYPHRSAYAQGSEKLDSVTFMLKKLDENGPGGAIWLKVEYQTFKRLVDNPDCVVFGIRTFVDPLHTIEAYPKAAAMLASNIRSIEGVGFRKYLGLDNPQVRQIVLRYLDALAIE
ncbi:hypothetical protein AAMO2058_000909500 [Amorphochlora amoebiformis]